MLRRTLLAASLAAALALPGFAQASEAPHVLFILDGSGSMWGRVDGTPKIELARSVLGDLIQKLPAEVQVGLEVYGHNRKDDCQDIEIVAPIGSDRQTLVDAANALNPKGKTPLTEAIRLAANEFRTHEGSSSIVVVSDGQETCSGDPCAAALLAAQNDVNLKIHVVGFDVSEEEAAQLNCIADGGNGQYFGAKNAEELVLAFAKVEKVVAQVAPAPEPMQSTGGVLFEDHFERAEIGEDWETVNPDPDRSVINDGKLLVVAADRSQVEVPTNLQLVRQTFDGNWVATVKMDMLVGKGNSGGFYYWIDQDNHLVVQIGGWCCGDYRRPWFGKKLNGAWNNIDPNPGSLGERPLGGYSSDVETWYLQIEKKGVTYFGRASIDGQNWLDIGRHTVIKQGRLGLSAYKWGGYVENAAEFDDLIVEAK